MCHAVLVHPTFTPFTPWFSTNLGLAVAVCFSVLLKLSISGLVNSDVAIFFLVYWLAVGKKLNASLDGSC